MSRKRKKNEIDADKVRQQAMDFGGLVGAQAKEAGEMAADFAEQGKAWASDVAIPTLDKAWRDGVKIAAPQVEAVAEKAGDAADQARDKLVDDYIPRLQKAMHDAAEAAESGDTVTEKATKAGAAAKKAVTTKPRKRRRGKVFGWILVGTVAAGTGYILWRRSQPIDDPWAEEYWDDAALTTPSSPAARDAAAATATAADKAAGAVKDAVGAATHGAGSAAESVKAGAQKASDKIADAADKAADAAEKTGDAAATKADDTADKAGDAADKAAEKTTHKKN